MRKVFITAYYFPPLGGAGVQRTLKFTKFLPEFGWQPSILTSQPHDARLSDVSQTEEIPLGVAIHRTPALILPPRLPWRARHFVARWLLVVDEQIGWLPFAVRRAKEIVRQENIQAIYSTSAPYTGHLIGLRLKQLTGLPWIADFRDLWVGNFAAPFPSAIHETFARRLERQIVTMANRIVVVSEPMRQALIDRYPELDPAHIVTLPNGYDPSDFEGQPPLSPEADKILIVHSGTFYGQRQSSLDCFLRAARLAIERLQIPPRKFCLRLVGNTGRPVYELVEASGLSESIQITGYLPHRQSIAHLLAADVLLLIIGCGPGSEAVFTGKIFEYLAAHKPILALAPPGAASDLVREARAGIVVDPEDAEAIAAQLASLCQQWQAGTLTITPDEAVIARYDRRQLTAKLASLLDEVSR